MYTLSRKKRSIAFQHRMCRLLRSLSADRSAAAPAPPINTTPERAPSSSHARTPPAPATQHCAPALVRRLDRAVNGDRRCQECHGEGGGGRGAGGAGRGRGAGAGAAVRLVEAGGLRARVPVRAYALGVVVLRQAARGGAEGVPLRVRARPAVQRMLVGPLPQP